MSEAVGQVLGFAVGVTLSPIPIIAVVLMLATPKGRLNGPAFLFGWAFALAAAGGLLLFAAGSADVSEGGAPSDRANVVLLLLGVLLILTAVKQWKSRPKLGEEPKLPAWMETIDTFSPPKALGMAFVFAVLNPKNLLLLVGAATAIAQTGVTSGEQAVALAVFVIVGSLGPGIPVAIYFFMKDRATELLEDMRDWLAKENATIMSVLCLVIGAKVIGDAISALAA